MTLFLAIFLTAALVVSNPLRSPLMIFFIVYALWRLQIERQCTLFAVRPRDPRPWPSRPDERRTREATSPASGSATG
jgi:hypothetical protein